MDEATRIVIENWPPTSPWYATWIPIAVALVAVVISLVSLSRSREEHINAVRPFVWASEFAHLDDQNRMVPQHNQVMLKVLNAPARVISATFMFEKVSPRTRKTILDHTDNNLYRYPDSGIQWTFTFSEFDAELKKTSADEHIERTILSIGVEK